MHYGVLVATDSAVRARLTDMLIAATAHPHQARLYTRNAADLAGLEQLLEVVAV